MDKLNWFFRQNVKDSEMVESTEFVEDGLNTIVREFMGTGITEGTDPVIDPDDLLNSILVPKTIAYNQLGERILVQSRFGDTAKLIVRGLSLNTDGIQGLSTVGTIILFNSSLTSIPFEFIGQDISIQRSQFPSNNGSFEIKDVFTTDLGGLIPLQIAVRIDEELTNDGYTPAVAPRGTRLLLRVDSDEVVPVDVGLDNLGSDIKPAAGNEKWVAVYLRTGRLEFDQRLDGNANVINLESLDYFSVDIDDTAGEFTVGNGSKPSLRNNVTDVFLADVKLIGGQNITQAEIDTSRRTYMGSVPSLGNKIFEYANAKFFGPELTWDGSNLETNGDVMVTLPNVSFKYIVSQFNIALADTEVIYVLLPRAITADTTVTAVKGQRGATPAGDDTFLSFEICGRFGDRIAGQITGELEPGETHSFGESLGQAVQTFTGQSGETDSDPNYAVLVSGGKTGTQNYESTQGDNLTRRLSLLTSAMANKSQDRLAKSISRINFFTNQEHATDNSLRTLTINASGSANWVLPNSSFSTTILLSGNLNLAANQAAYFTIDRNADKTINSLADLTVANTSVITLSENINIFAIRGSDETITLWNGLTLLDGVTLPQHKISQEIDQNFNARLVSGGLWGFVLRDPLLVPDTPANVDRIILTTDAYISVPGLTLTRNTVQSAELPIDDGQALYVVLNRVSGSTANLAVVQADIDQVPKTGDEYVLAARVGNVVYISDMALVPGEMRILGGSISENNKLYLGINSRAQSTPAYTHAPSFFDTEANLTDAVSRVDKALSDISGKFKIEPLTDPGKVRILSNFKALFGDQNISTVLEGFLVDFEGAVIDFTTGRVWNADETVEIGTTFTPVIPAAGQFRWFSISLKSTASNSLNLLGVNFTIAPALSDGATAAAAERANFAEAITIGQVAISSVDGAVLDPVLTANVVNVDRTGGSDADKLRGLAGEAIAALKTVYLSPGDACGDTGRTQGRYYISEVKNTDPAILAIRSRIKGLAVKDATSGGVIEVKTAGPMKGFTGLEPGKTYFADPNANGDLINVDAREVNTYSEEIGESISPQVLLLNRAMAETRKLNIPSDNPSWPSVLVQDEIGLVQALTDLPVGGVICVIAPFSITQEITLQSGIVLVGRSRDVQITIGVGGCFILSDDSEIRDTKIGHTKPTGPLVKMPNAGSTLTKTRFIINNNDDIVGVEVSGTFNVIERCFFQGVIGPGPGTGIFYSGGSSNRDVNSIFQ